MDNRFVLPANTVLDGNYRILRVVGSGGFGVTYEAEDIGLGTMVAVKEYYPIDFGDRDAGMSVRPKSQRHEQTFDWGRTNFLQEARTLAQFEHPSIVRVTRVFEANATAYMVMRFEQGLSFEAWLTSLRRPPTQDELDAITSPLLDALEVMHAANFLHRDIAPDNIIVRIDGTPVLLDFGTARRAVAEMSRALTGIVKAGYSPQEQYATDGRLQGPWSDIYAFGGTLYRAVTGKAPEESTLRAIDDHVVPAAKAAIGRYRPEFLAGIDACLKVKHAERPRSVAQLRPMLLGPKALKTERYVEMGTAPITRQSITEIITSAPAGARRWLTAAGIVLVLLACGYGGFEYSRWKAPKGEVAGEEPPGDGVLRFDQPIAVGPYPVNSHSLKDLIEGVPLFPPIEGLDEALWKKTCSSCHKWDKARLCEQGKTYTKAEKYILRLPHPYGGSFKVALKRWAESGCQ